jgi:hypothetical protein
MPMMAGLKLLLSAGGLMALAGGWAAFEEWPEEPRTVQVAGLVEQQSAASAIAAPVWLSPAGEQGGSVEQDGINPPVRLESLEGIALTDAPWDVIEKKGKPAETRGDSRLDDMEIYDYGDWEVAFREGDILYVAVEAAAEQMLLDGVSYPLQLKTLRESLGEPNHLAEDGWVYTKPQGAIKLYVEPATGDLLSVHYFHATGL